MSLIDLQTLSPGCLVAQFVLSRRGQGLCLSREDHECIEAWLQAGADPDFLLFVLDEVLPPPLPGKRPLPLRLCHKKVLRRLMRARSQAEAVPAR